MDVVCPHKNFILIAAVLVRLILTLRLTLTLTLTCKSKTSAALFYLRQFLTPGHWFTQVVI